MWSSPKNFGEPWSIWIGQPVIDASTRVSLLGTAGWIICFLQTNWHCMRGSSQQVLQHASDRFSAACDQAETKISTKNLRYCVSHDAQGSVFCTWAKIHCSRWRRSSTLGWYSRVTEVGIKALIHSLVKLTQFCAGPDPTSKLRGAISVIFGIHVSLRVHFCKRD